MPVKEDYADGIDEFHDDDANAFAAAINHPPYDVTFVQTLGTRAVGYGENVVGIKLQRAVTFTKVTFRCETAGDGSLVVEARKNGSQVSGTPTTLTVAQQTPSTGNSSTGSWSFAEGDILTVYITSAGSNPGDGLTADFKGALT